jgi:hypothetical protein
VVGPVYAVFTPLILLGRFNETLSDALGGKERNRQRAIRENIVSGQPTASRVADR